MQNLSKYIKEAFDWRKAQLDQFRKDLNGPQNNNIYIFWTAKISSDGTQWLNGVSGDTVLYDTAHSRVMGTSGKFKEMFIAQCQTKIEALVKEKFPDATDYKIFYDSVFGSDVFQNNKYLITWKNCFMNKKTEDCVIFMDNRSELDKIENLAKKEYEKIEDERHQDELKKQEEEIKRAKDAEERQAFWKKLEGYKNLGYANSWNENPLTGQDLRKYRNAKDVQEIKLGNSHYLCYSDQEEIKWYYDSSD